MDVLTSEASAEAHNKSATEAVVPYQPRMLLDIIQNRVSLIIVGHRFSCFNPN